MPTQGTIVVPLSGADRNSDAMIDEGDYGMWTAHFGMAVSTPDSGSAADVPPFNALAFEIREPTESLSTETTSPPNEAIVAAARALQIAMLDHLSRRQDIDLQSRERIQRYGLAQPGREELQLLAINRTGRTSPLGVAVVYDPERDDVHAVDWESQSLIDDSPAAALAE